MERLFDYTTKFVEQVNSTNSTNEKLEILKKFNDPEFLSLIKRVYDPMIQFNITSKNCIKRSDLIADFTEESLLELLDQLSCRYYTGNKAIEKVNRFVINNEPYKELIYNILDKNLKTRTDLKLINKAYKNLIPEFKVQLANDGTELLDKLSFKDKWYASRKLDGIRCIAIVQGTTVSFFSRSGKEFFTLDKLKKPLLSLAGGTSTVFDGEVCIVDQEGKENFTSIVSDIRKKDFTIEHPKFMMFDILSLDEFNLFEKSEVFEKRYELLQELTKYPEFDTKYLEVLDQVQIKDLDHLLSMQEEASDKGYEGLIVRKNVIYEGKRSKNMLKLKKFYDAEYIVKDIVTGPIRFIDYSSGESKEIEEDLLSAVIIEHKGNLVNVGSGFSLEQRKLYKENPDKIIGKTITVKYFEESQNKEGIKSLRFPTVKAIYERGRD